MSPARLFASLTCPLLLSFAPALFSAASSLAAQERATLRIVVRSDAGPEADANITVGTQTVKTDVSGSASLAVAAGRVEGTVTKDSFVPVTVSVEVAPGAEQLVYVQLQRAPDLEEHVTVVAATRTNKPLEDQTMRVEILEREEIEEKMLMTPGDIVMMLNEMGGMRVQATSPSLGAASVRIQGMRGRYTRVLSDGLPLHGEVGGLGLLQIPPMDLGQVEVIKGVASALYGAGAMGGVVNLGSRRPGDDAVRELLVNQSTRGATDVVAFLSGPLTRGWSASLLAGGHRHAMADVDDDGWADLPGYERLVARPRVFWDGEAGRSLFATAGVTVEGRNGGTADGLSLPATGLPYLEALDTRRYDAGVVGQYLWRDLVVTGRGSIVRQRHDHRFGDIVERDRHDTAFAEVAVRGGGGQHTWVGGAAFERDAYTPRDLSRFKYIFTVPAAFAGYDVAITPALSLSASGRVDAHSEHGTFFSPRLSTRARIGAWTSRFSIGTGFAAATPLTEETEAAGLTRLRIDGRLEAERGLSASFDLARSDGPFAYSATLFASRIEHPLYVERSSEYVLRNLDDPTTNVGLELLGSVRAEPWALTATYTYVRARETVDDVEREAPLTPAHSAGVVGMWEAEETGRIGVEWYFTGRQRLDENPFRITSRRYVVFGVLAERRFGRFRLFVNGENLTGTRQTAWEPLVRAAPGPDGRWTVDAWAPLDGRNVNGGVRVQF